MSLLHIVLIATFIAALLAVEAFYGFWYVTHGPESRRLARRLRLMTTNDQGEEHVSILKKRQLANVPVIERLLLSIPRIQKLDRLLEQSGYGMNVATLILLMALLFIIAFFMGWYFSGLKMFGLVAGIAFASLPPFFVVRAKYKRTHTMLFQLPDALDLMARSLRAGHAFSGGLKMVADEMPDPISTEFHLTFDELNYGLPLETAMLHMADRIDVPDMKYFVISVLIQRETGGNLAAIMEKIASLIRERLKLLGRVRVLSTQGRLEAWILSILPFAIASILFMIWPQFMSLLWTENAGRVMIGIAGIMMFIGIIVMWRMVRIRV